MKPTYKDYEKKNILVLGAGFAGVRAALDLDGYLKDFPEYEIILIDRKDYQLYHPALYEAATAEHGLVEAKKVKRTVAIPLSKIFKHTKVKLLKAYVEGLDLEGGMVQTDSGIVNYNYLVMALGSVADYNGIKNFERYGFSLKTLEDAIMIRNRIEDMVSKKDSGRIVVVGAGFSGTEFLGELKNLVRHEAAHHGKESSHFQILAIEGATGYLPGLPENVSEFVANRLKDLGIAADFSSLITDAGSDYVVLNNKVRFDCDLLVWAGGVRARKLPIQPEIERDRKDRIITTQFLNLKKFPSVFSCGDGGNMADPESKKPLPQTAYEAIAQGRQAAKNVFRSIKKEELGPYRPQPVRYVIPVSGKNAVYYSKNLFLSGFPAWLLRRAIDFKYLLSVLPLFTALNLWFFETKIFVKND